jgi:hypothetical protein
VREQAHAVPTVLAQAVLANLTSLVPAPPAAGAVAIAVGAPLGLGFEQAFGAIEWIHRRRGVERLPHGVG